MEEQLRNKIQELFNYRGFPELFEYSGTDDNEKNKLEKNLFDLQAKIYYLDGYLESNWKLNTKDLKHFWDEIFKSLKKCGIADEELGKYCAQILKYQKHEIDLRSNLLPTRLNMEYFYFYKSCDVKLMRRLLLEKLEGINRLFTTGDWRYFDLVTEVNDDVTDIEEDLTTINGNRVLISLKENGKAITLQEFTDFLNYCAQKSTQRFGTSVTTYKRTIHNKTLEQIKITKKLLQSQLTKFSTQSDFVLYDYIEKENRA